MRMDSVLKKGPIGGATGPEEAVERPSATTLRSEVRGPSVREHAGPEGADAAADMMSLLSERTTTPRLHATPNTWTRGPGHVDSSGHENM